MFISGWDIEVPEYIQEDHILEENLLLLLPSGLTHVGSESHHSNSHKQLSTQHSNRWFNPFHLHHCVHVHLQLHFWTAFCICSVFRLRPISLKSLRLAKISTIVKCLRMTLYCSWRRVAFS